MIEPFIVAEVSKNWFRGPEHWEPLSETRPIQGLFEMIINLNWERGYVLHSFQFSQSQGTPDEMNETIIAVFRHQSLPL